MVFIYLWHSYSHFISREQNLMFLSLFPNITGITWCQKSPFPEVVGMFGRAEKSNSWIFQILVLTATATKSTKERILHTLQLSLNDMKLVEQSPNRPNLRYDVKYLDTNEPIEVAFSALITELNIVGTEVPRTLIYCQTRKQCSVLFRAFEVFLGTNIFNGSKSPKNRIVEMYHAGTPKTVKDHIVKNMATEIGHLRVLISTIAFGLGIDCKKVRRVIHFGPSKSIEMYVQECGRAGRDGLPSTSVFLYNGVLSSHCDNDMKQYIQVEGCRRKWLMGHFGCNGEQTSGALALHACCDMCAIKCSCGGDHCTTS